MSSVGSISIPGLSGLGNISATAGFGILEKNGEAKELAMVAKAPQIQREQEYFDKTIKDIKTVDEFVKDRRLVKYVLTAYGLQSEADKVGILQKVFKEDPNLKASLVNKLADSRFATMAKALDFFNSGLANLKGATTKENFSLQTLGNRYVEVQTQDALGNANKTLFTNNAPVTVGSNGKLQTADGFLVMGMKLDNRGQLQSPSGTAGDYLAKDIKPVQVNWLDGKFTPTQTVTPHAIIDSAQPVAELQSYSGAQLIKDPDGNEQLVQIKLASVNNHGLWSFDVKKSDGTVLGSVWARMFFDDSGNVSSIEGQDGTNVSFNLNWGTGTTTQKIGMAPIAHHADFSQDASVYDQTGVKRNIKLEYNKVDAATNRWQVKVYNSDLGTLGGTLDVEFNDNGTVKTVGKYNAVTGKIEIPKGDTANAGSVSVEWDRGYGPSSLSIDLSDVRSLAGGNFTTKAANNDSIALGARTSVDIDRNGVVSATYNKADGSGTKKVSLYQLSVVTFDKAGGLQPENGKDGYYNNTIEKAGNVIYRPTGTKDGQGGALAADAKTVSTTSFIDTLKTKYQHAQYEVALGDQNEALRYAVHFKKAAGSITSMYALMSDRALRNVVDKVFDLPPGMSKQPIETQEAALSRRLDVKKLQDPKFVEQFIKRFLAASDASGGGNSQASVYGGLLDGSASAGNLTSFIGSHLSTSA